MDAGQECRAGSHVIASAVAERAPLDLRQPAEDHQVFAERLQRLHRRCELEVGPFDLRRPLIHDDSVGNINEAETYSRLCAGRERRRHCVEQRQSYRYAHPAQKRAARQRFSGHDHYWRPPPKTYRRLSNLRISRLMSRSVPIKRLDNEASAALDNLRYIWLQTLPHLERFTVDDCI